MASIRTERRLFACIIVAAHRACDDHQLETARQLLLLGERVLTGGPGSEDRRRRQDLWMLIAAYERLWELRRDGADAPGYSA